MMNIRRVAHVLSFVLFALGLALWIPMPWALGPVDLPAATGLSAGSLLTLALGFLLRTCGDARGEIDRREGVLIVVAAWGLASLVGAVPFVVSGAIPDRVDALFESVSGFTTTGASILVDFEALPSAIQVWRSLTQWLGGIGIVVLFVALLSKIGPGARMLFQLETPGPRTQIHHARIKQAAIGVFRIYLALSVLQLAAMLVFGASFFDALTHTFATVSTGGFSPYAQSVAVLPASLQLVILIFMVASAVNFGLYEAVFERSRSPLRDEEFRSYLVIIVVASGVVALCLTRREGLARAVLDAAFQVASIMTTTGFSTTDYSSWPTWALALLCSLMAVGGCAGSTAGGFKVVRLLVAGRALAREILLTISPNSVVAISVEKQPFSEASTRAVLALILVWILGWATGALLLSIGDVDLVTAASASLATVSNIGPGLSAVGPIENYAFFAPWQKIVIVALMWLGRLEFFTVLALFLPRFWKP